MPACRCVPDSDPYNFLAIYKFSNNQEKLLFLPLVQQQKWKSKFKVNVIKLGRNHIISQHIASGEF